MTSAQKGYIVGNLSKHLVSTSLLLGATLSSPGLLYAQSGNPNLYGTSGDDDIIVGCVNHDGTGARAWGCVNGRPGDDYQLMDLYDCTMGEIYTIVSYGGADVINLVRATGNHTCGGETKSWSPLAHAGYDLDVFAGTDDDIVYGDNSAGADCVIYGGDGDDILEAWGPYSLYGQHGDDTLLTYSSSTHDRLFGNEGDDCLWDAGTAGCDYMDCGEGEEVYGDRVVLKSSCDEQNYEQSVPYCVL